MRFGYERFEQVVQGLGGKIEILENVSSHDETELAQDVLAIIMPIVLLLFFKIRFIPIAKHITEAYDIAKALNNNPVGLSLIPIAKSRLFICATGMISIICKNTYKIFITE